MKINQKIIIPTIAIMLFLPIVMALTITGQSSSYTFTIDNCTYTPNITLNCSPSTVRFQCDIYNPAFINTVEYRIQGLDYTTTQNSTNPYQFYYDYNKPADTSSTNSPILLDRERITDVSNKKVNAYLLASIPRSCTVCEHTYNVTIISACNTSNQQILQYTSSNLSCSPSYNSTQSCNYCSPNIFANYSECDQNGTRTVNYFDLNYSTCCLTTGLSEDCIINTPTYQNKNETCNFYNQDFTCQVDSSPVLNDKINLNCELPNSEDTCCVINIYQGNNFTSLLQTSPEYKSTSNSFFLTREQETRTCFTPNQRLLNAYYTEKELRPETDYKLEVVCTSNTSTLKSSYQIKPVYHTPDWAFNRFTWFTNNTTFTFSALIAIVIMVALGIYLVKKIK